jgi:hypothetical protein
MATRTLWSKLVPKLSAERQDGADNLDSRYYPCGYPPDAAGSSARCNYESGL